MILPPEVALLAQLPPSLRVPPLAAIFEPLWAERLNGMGRCRIGIVCERSWNPLDDPDPIDEAAQALIDNGACPRLVYLGRAGPERQLDDVDGLLHPGGFDISPQLYGQPDQGSHAEKIDEPFDRFQLRCVELARRRRMPMLGLCRGAQILNVAAGGTLQQHIERHEQAQAIEEPAHPVHVEPGSMLAQVLIPPTVNSEHHQAVDRLGPGLVVTARAPDGTVEGLESTGVGWEVACEFHPEELRRTQPRLNELFQELILQATRYRA